jgi:predicted nucleic acid-binding protein
VIATYLDSSALVRLCVSEGDLREVESAMSGLPVTSVLAAVEMPAAVWARFHRGEVSDTQRDELLATAEEILGSLGQVGFSAAVRKQAIVAAGGNLLRALDAVHVGTAVVVSQVQRRRGNELRFCTGDVRQGRAAAALLGEAQVTVLAPL